MLNFPSALEVALQHQVDRLQGENEYLRRMAGNTHSVMFDPQEMDVAYPPGSSVYLPSVSQVRAEPSGKFGSFHVMSKAQTNTGQFALDYFVSDQVLYDVKWASRALSMLHEKFLMQLGTWVRDQK